MAARAIGRLTETAPDDEDDELDELEDDELDDELDELEDDELDEEEEEDEGGESPLEPPPPQAGRIVAQTSIPAIRSGARRRSDISVTSSIVRVGCSNRACAEPDQQPLFRASSSCRLPQTSWVLHGGSYGHAKAKARGCGWSAFSSPRLS